tara:strand:- start:58 stop:1494 length:1437 start_codon:yes stop_codon:yes gene_type:complete
MAKSKVIDGYSYEYDSLGKIIGVFDHTSDPVNPKPVNPKSRLYEDRVRTNGALTAFNFNRYGGNKDSYENSVELPPIEQRKAFYDKEVKDNKERLKEQNDAGLSNPSLASAPGPASAYASYKRDRKTGNTDLFTYPLDIDPKQDHLKISKYKYARNEDSGVKSSVQGSRPDNVNYKNVPLTDGERFSNLFKSKSERVQPVRLQKVVRGDSMLGNQLLGSVMLPMPKVVDTNGCEWGESEVNIFGLAALGSFEAGKRLINRRGNVDKLLETDALQGIDKQDLLDVEKIAAGANKGRNLFKNFKQGGSALLNAAAAEATARVTGQSISQDQILARTSGRVLNPNAELLFQGPVLRDFNFDFLMIARSEQEGKEIRKIIRWFKSGMAPNFNGATFLQTPDIFTLEYRNGTRPGDVLKTVNRFSPGGLALRTVAVDYAPSGYWSAYQDSQPVALKVSLNFAELRPIYAQDQNQHGTVDTVGY